MKLTFATDKILHAFAGYMLYMTFYPFAIEYGLAASAIVAVGKEVYDYVSSRYFKAAHTPDVMDAIVTVAGGGVGYAVQQLLERLM